MIQEYIDAWNENKDRFEYWLRIDVDANTLSYEDIVKGIIDEVINPYIDSNYDKLDVEKMTVIDDGDYQGTYIYIIPKNCYQPSVCDYVMTDNYYGSCSGCDALLGVQDSWGKEVSDDTIEGIMTIALHLIEKMKPLGGE